MITAAFLGVAACGGDESSVACAAPMRAADAADIFAGIPQQGVLLGNPNAPVTLTEFLDLQCPYCRQFALGTLPAIVQRYVRSGQVRIIFRNLAFLGPDSKSAAQMTAAVGLQDHLWQFADLFLRNQGAENSGFVTEPFLYRLAGTLPGVDARRAMGDRGSSAVAQQLDDAKVEAQRFGIQSTPSFLLGRTGEAPRVLRLSSIAPEAFFWAIDGILGSR
jgi:protein-disulfide isomerase